MTLFVAFDSPKEAGEFLDRQAMRAGMPWVAVSVGRGRQAEGSVTVRISEEIVAVKDGRVAAKITTEEAASYERREVPAPDGARIQLPAKETVAYVDARDVSAVAVGALR